MSDQGIGLTVVETTETAWDEAEPDVREFERGLRQLGLPDDVVRADTELAYRSAQAPSGRRYWDYSDEQVLAASRRIRSTMLELLGRRKTSVIRTERVPVRVPLLYLSAPSIGKCRVTYKYTESFELDHTWTVKVVGLGFGQTRSVKLEVKRGFEVHAGDEKVIFVPATLLVSEVATREADGTEHQGVRTELAPLEPGEVPAQSIALVPQDQRSDTSGSEFLRQPYDLSDDKPGDIETEDWQLTATGSRAFSAEVGADLLKTSVKFESAVKRERAVTLDLELEGGQRYEMRRLRDRDGICWI